MHYTLSHLFQHATQAFWFGSVPLKTYLPDGDIDVCAFTATGTSAEWVSHSFSLLQSMTAHSCHTKYPHINIELMFALYYCRVITPSQCLFIVRSSCISPHAHNQFPHFQRVLESEARNPLAHFPIKNITVINADVRWSMHIRVSVDRIQH